MAASCNAPSVVAHETLPAAYFRVESPCAAGADVDHAPAAARTDVTATTMTLNPWERCIWIRIVTARWRLVKASAPCRLGGLTRGAYGIRTRAAAVRGRCPRPLDECARRRLSVAASRAGHGSC